VYGRNDLALYRSDGTVLLPSTFSEIYSKLLYELRTNKVRNTKIIQHDFSNLEIQVVIDDTLRTTSPSDEEIYEFLRKGFQGKMGPDVTVTVKEVSSVDTSQGPRIVSLIDKKNYIIIRYM
jgi:hypothetical protein